jgi:hypothetical protein
MECLVWIVISLAAIKISNLIVGIGQDIYLFITNIYQLFRFISNKKLII